MATYDDVPRITFGPGSPASPIRRLGVIGDVHAEDARLAVALTTLEQGGAERIVCVGDVADGAGDLDRTMALLDAHRVITIAGNHERWFLGDTMRSLSHIQRREDHPAAAEAMRLYPPLLEMDTVRGALLLCHAVGRDDMTVLDDRTTLPMARWMPEFVALEATERIALVVAGHTHRFFVRQFPSFVWINAGTLKRDDHPCFVMLDLEAGQAIHYVLDEALAVERRIVALDAAPLTARAASTPPRGRSRT